MKANKRCVSGSWLLLIALFGIEPACALELTYIDASSEEYAVPHDITLSPDRKRLFVADNNNDRVAVLDATSLKLLFSFGENILGSPHDVEFDHKGRLLVADTNNSRIAYFQVSDNKARFTGELRGQFRRPEGVAVHPDGRIYVTGASSDDIEVFLEGRSVGHVGGFASPHDVAVGKDGSIWIADAGNDRLVHMTHDLKFIKSLKGEPYFFSGPRYLAFDSKTRLYVADKYNHQIKILSADNSLLLTLGTGNRGKGPDQFNRPEGITIHGNEVWFADTYNDRIVKYRITE